MNVSRRASIIKLATSAITVSSATSNTYALGKIVTPEDFYPTTAEDDTGWLQAIKSAIAYLKSIGGGNLNFSGRTYYIKITKPQDTIIIDSSNIKISGSKDTIIQWDYYGAPLFSFIGCNDCEISELNIIWRGQRGGPPPTARTGTYDGTGIISPPDLCCHIFIGGCNSTSITNITWRGQTHRNNIEVGISIYNGDAKGPSRTTKNSGNSITNVTSSDVYFGIVLYGQKYSSIKNIQSHQYLVAGHVGGGHVIYATGSHDRILIENIFDDGVPLEESDTRGFTAPTIQVRSMTNSIIRNISSKRPDGLIGILNNSTGNAIYDLFWTADRTPYEDRLKNSTIITIAQGDDISELSDNIFFNWTIIDIPGPKGQSANAGIIGTSGAKISPSHSKSNRFKEISIEFTPDANFGKSVFTTFGHNNSYDISINNRGSIDKEIFHISDGKDGDKSNNIDAKIKVNRENKNPKTSSQSKDGIRIYTYTQ